MGLKEPRANMTDSISYCTNILKYMDVALKIDILSRTAASFICTSLKIVFGNLPLANLSEYVNIYYESVKG